MEKAHHNIPVHNFPPPKPGKEGIVAMKDGKIQGSPEDTLGEDRDYEPMIETPVIPDESKIKNSTPDGASKKELELPDSVGGDKSNTKKPRPVELDTILTDPQINKKGER